MKSVAIIGAGISGLTLARELYQKAKVVVFEKARGVGGRMSTRYAEPFSFDSGAQCFTARTQAFNNFLKPYFEKGIISEWAGRVINLELGKAETERLWREKHLVASPNMNSLCKDLAQDIDIKTSCEIAPLPKIRGKAWSLVDKNGNDLGDFDWVISTAPPVQTSRLFSLHLPMDSALNSVNMEPCYSLMIGFDMPWDREWIAAKVRNNPIKWISVNSTKPGRNHDVTSLVAHSRSKWAVKHIDDDLSTVRSLMLEQFTKVTGIDFKNSKYIEMHRWLYAIIDRSEKKGGYLDMNLKLAATSDWCETSRIEEVWHHASIVANYIAKTV